MSTCEMFSRIDSLVKQECGAGATDREIADAERALGVRFPESYKAFLSRFAWAQIYLATSFDLWLVDRIANSPHANEG